MEFLLEYFYPRPAQITRSPAKPPVFDNPQQQEIWTTICQKCRFVENNFYIDIIKAAPLEHLTPILEGLDIFASQLGTSVTLELTALLKDAGLYAPFFARGYTKFCITAESKNSSSLVSSFKNLLLESQRYACPIGEALALSLNCSGTRMFDELSVDFLIALIERQPLEHRHSLIIGLIHLFLSNNTLTQNKALLLSRISPVAAEFGLFWSALNRAHPHEACDNIFHLLIEYPNSIKKLHPIINDPVVASFIRSGYLAQMVKRPCVTQYTIKMFHSGGEPLTQNIWTCIEAHPKNNQAIFNIMTILYGAGALSVNTVNLLTPLPSSKIEILDKAVEHTSYWISQKSFAALCNSKTENILNLSHSIKKEAEERFISTKDFYIQELLDEITAQHITASEQSMLRDLCLELFELSEEPEKADTFLFIKKLIKNPSVEPSAKVAFMVHAKEQLVSIRREDLAAATCTSSALLLSPGYESQTQNASRFKKQP